MATYCQVDDLSSPACTPGSALVPTLGNEYGKPLLFLQLTSKTVNLHAVKV